jgi:putative SOS response-associated peptidase YedK
MPDSTPNFAQTYNLAPTDPIPIVRRDPDDGLRRLDVLRWGLLPFNIEFRYAAIMPSSCQECSMEHRAEPPQALRR